MTNKEISELFGEELKSGDVIVVAAEPTTKGDKMKLLLAQMREGTQSAGMMIAGYTGTQIQQAYINNVQMDAFQKHVDAGRIKLDKDNNFVAGAFPGAEFRIVVEESTKPFGWYEKDGVKTCNKAKFRQREGAFPTFNGLPIWRRTVIAFADAQDTLIKDNGSMSEEEYEAYVAEAAAVAAA